MSKREYVNALDIVRSAQHPMGMAIQHYSIENDEIIYLHPVSGFYAPGKKEGLHRYEIAYAYDGREVVGIFACIVELEALGWKLIEKRPYPRRNLADELTEKVAQE